MHTCVGWLFGHLHRQTLCFGSVRSSPPGPTAAKNNVGMGPCFTSAFSLAFSSAVSVRWTFSQPHKQHLRHADIRGTRRRCLHERGCNGNRVAADSRAQLSVISLLTHGLSTGDMRPTRACVQVVSMGSHWSEVQNKMLKFDTSTLARVEFAVRSGLGMLQRCISLHACHLHSVFYFFSHKIREMSHMNCGVLTQYQTQLLASPSGKPDCLQYKY